MTLANLDKIFKRLRLDPENPTAIICHTVKGKGIPSPKTIRSGITRRNAA